MARGFTFGATMRGFFIVAVVFFGGMVMAGGGGGQGREGGEEEVGRERQARRRDKGCSVREPAGGCGKLGGNRRIGLNRQERCGVTAKRDPGVGLALPRCAGAPDMILPRRDQRGSAGSFIGLAPAPP
jgi:hypothetical protein